MHMQPTFRSRPELHDLLLWFERAIDDTAYGEVGFIAVKHDNRIVRIKRIHQTSHQPPKLSREDPASHPGGKE